VEKVLPVLHHRQIPAVGLNVALCLWLMQSLTSDWTGNTKGWPWLSKWKTFICTEAFALKNTYVRYPKMDLANFEFLTIDFVKQLNRFFTTSYQVGSLNKTFFVT
jgi:hypothetical protein